MACDMCGKATTSLENLSDTYATDKIKMLCSDCMCLTNKQLWAIRELSNKINQTALKRFMSVFRKRKFNLAQEEKANE